MAPPTAGDAVIAANFAKSLAGEQFVQSRITIPFLGNRSLHLAVLCASPIRETLRINLKHTASHKWLGRIIYTEWQPVILWRNSRAEQSALSPHRLSVLSGQQKMLLHRQGRLQHPCHPSRKILPDQRVPQPWSF